VRKLKSDAPSGGTLGVFPSGDFDFSLWTSWRDAGCFPLWGLRLQLVDLLEGRRVISHLGTSPWGALGETQGELPSEASDYYYVIIIIVCSIVSYIFVLLFVVWLLYVIVPLLPKYMTIIVISSDDSLFHPFSSLVRVWLTSSGNSHHSSCSVHDQSFNWSEVRS
jgi:hypothetical protein